MSIESTEKESESKLDLAKVKKAVFLPDQDTVVALVDKVSKVHKETGSGIGAKELAEELCGDQRFFQTINLIVLKCCEGVLEIRHGVGVIPFGAEAKKNTRTVEPPTPEYTERVSDLVHSILNTPGISKFSLKGLCKKAAVSDATSNDPIKFLGEQDEEGNDDERTFRAALNILSHSENSKYELKGGDIMKRKAVFNPLAENKMPTRPGAAQHIAGK